MKLCLLTLSLFGLLYKLSLAQFLQSRNIKTSKFREINASRTARLTVVDEDDDKRPERDRDHDGGVRRNAVQNPLHSQAVADRLRKIYNRLRNSEATVD